MGSPLSLISSCVQQDLPLPSIFQEGPAQVLCVHRWAWAQTSVVPASPHSFSPADRAGSALLCHSLVFCLETVLSSYYISVWDLGYPIANAKIGKCSVKSSTSENAALLHHISLEIIFTPCTVTCVLFCPGSQSPKGAPLHNGDDRSRAASTYY